MEDFVAKLNQKCAEKNLGFQYEVIQEEDPPSWDKPMITKYQMNTEKYDAVITTAVGPLMQFGLVPYFTAANSKVPVIGASMGNSISHFPIPPSNMFFPTPALSFVYDDITRMFLAEGFKKYAIVTEVCDLLDFIYKDAEEKKKASYGEGNYWCVNPRPPCPGNETFKCPRPEEEVIEEIGDADIVEFFEYYSEIPLITYMDEKKINYKAKIFFSQLPFQDDNLGAALYGLIEQRGFSEDALYNEMYDDGRNNLGIFAPEGNKTSQQVFNEWFVSHNSTQLKLSVIGEIIGWYYLHENILRARKANATDLSAVMRGGLFFPSIIGIAGTGMSQKNDRVSKPLWMQVLPDLENNRKPKRSIMYPLEIAHVYSYHPMVEHDDRDCYPNCPDCYDNVCEEMATVMFISLITVVATLTLVMIIAICIFTRKKRLELMYETWTFVYVIVELIAAICAITSIHSIRNTKDNQSSLLKWMLTFFSGFDGLTAVFRGSSWATDHIFGLPLIPYEIFYIWESINATFILMGTGIYFIYITHSEVETKSSAPQIIDITLNLIEVCMFVLTSPQTKSFRDSMRDSQRSGKSDEGESQSDA